jgi:peptide/nickel transport system substrate-binding protein
MEATILRERLFNNDFELVKAFNSSDVIDPSQSTSSFLCRMTQPVMGVCREDMEKLYTESETMLVTEEREEAFHQMMQMAQEWAVFIPVYYAPARTAISDRVHGFQILPTGNFRLWEVWVEN